jgi:YfiH family protein
VQLIVPDWPAPPRVRAASTTRAGGASRGVYAGLNLADHVGDRSEHVLDNRSLLRSRLGLPGEPLWLQQVHGTRVLSDPTVSSVKIAVGRAPEADGACTRAPGVVCAVMTADCLPVLLCDRQGTRVAALHAGWRGLAAGILEGGIAAMGGVAGEILVWIGPGIGADAFEVGSEVRARFVDDDPDAALAFRPSGSGRHWADLVALARHRLSRLGVTEIHGGGYCTFSDPTRFFSYRRDGVTGRMASMIWLDADHPGDGETRHA